MSNHTVKGLLGQPVITVSSGRRVGSIQEILFDAAEARVTAVILSKPPVTGAAKAVLAEHITLFGADVTLVDDDSSVVPLPESSSSSVRASTTVIRTQVITSEGRRIGEVRDIALDARGNVLGYHLSHNIIRDGLRGKPYLAVSIVRAVGSDAVIVDAQGLQAVVAETVPEPTLESAAAEEVPSEAEAAIECGAEVEATTLPTDLETADANQASDSSVCG